MSGMKRVVAIHDLSGFGKASLTVVIPTLSAMGIQVCPLPTALLSAHTGFPGFTFLDLTSEMRKIIAHWKSLNLYFDAIYSGFLGSPEQVDIVSDFIKDFSGNMPLVLVDPVLGDDGALYPTMNNEMVEKMRQLVKKADIVTPNLTEAALLSGNEYNENVPRKELVSWMRKIAENGPRYVVVTSAPSSCDLVSVLAYDRDEDLGYGESCRRFPGTFSGAGDAFTSILLGNLLYGHGLSFSFETALGFVSSTLAITHYAGSKEMLLEEAIDRYFSSRRRS